MWSASPILALVAALLVPSASWIYSVPEGDASRLVWKNGDAFPGALLESEPGEVRWASPHFAEPLVVDVAALASIAFPEQPVPAFEAHKVGMVSGDVLVADLVGVDGEGFLLWSRRHGEIHVARDMVHSLSRQHHPNLLFDGSQFAAWTPARASASGDTRGRTGFSTTDWGPDAEGHPYTDVAQAEMTRALDWPERFELVVEFASAERPGFVLALGRDLDRALRLETWGDDLVIAQGKQFERVLTVEEGQQEVRLRLAFDGGLGVVTVHDLTGLLLAELSGVRPLKQDAGLIIRSRGRDLMVKRLRGYRQTSKGPRQPVDWARPRVHIVDGQVIYGRLFDSGEVAYVLAGDGARRDVDLREIDRLVRPDLELGAVGGPAQLTYADGSVLRGSVEGLNGDRVTLRTAFADEPVASVLAGASRLEFGSAPERDEEEYEDELVYSTGTLRGRISFDGQDGSLIQWQVVGGVEPVPVAFGGGTHIRRGRGSVSSAGAYDREAYPDVLRLKSRDVIACEVVSADDEKVQFRSPLVEAGSLDTRHVKAIEFSPGGIASRPTADVQLSIQGSRAMAMRMILAEQQNHQGAGQLEIVVQFAGPEGEARIIRVDGNGMMITPNGGVKGVDDDALDRALTVPRFLRDDPPTHVLMAKTGDLLRGRLLSIDKQTVRFESKLRSLDVPIDRVARVVDVSRPDDDAAASRATDGTFHITLADGSSLVFTPLESKDGKLSGNSPIYGAVAVSVNSIAHVRSGVDGTDASLALFEDWVVHPGKEPVFGGDE
ncbi:MAG: hypothetical protein ABGY41_21015 [Candidatus Poribacteria bacterium]